MREGRTYTYIIYCARHAARLLCLLLCAVTLCACGRDDDEWFNTQIQMLENNPSLVLERYDTCRVQTVAGMDDATAWLLQSLARKYNGLDSCTDKEGLLQCIDIFREGKKPYRRLEAMFLLAEAYRDEGDLEREVQTIEEAVDIAQDEDDNLWLFHLYSYLADMYIRHYDMVQFVRYQSMANDCLKNIDTGSLDPFSQMLLAKSYLYTGQPARAVKLLASLQEKTGRHHVAYPEILLLHGNALCRLGKWSEAISLLRKAEGLLTGRAGRFACSSMLAMAYFYAGDMQNASLYRKKAESYDDAESTSLYEVDFYNVCADLSAEAGDDAAAAAYLRKVTGRYGQIVDEMGQHRLYKAFQKYTDMREELEYGRYVRMYQTAVIAALVALLVMAVVYGRRRRKLLYRYLALQKQIESLELMRGMKEETKAFISKDIDLARQIAMLKYTQKEKCDKLMEELGKLDLVRENDILGMQWDSFYRHIDILLDGFHSRLVAAYPELGEKEIQLCCMLAGGFKTEEIAAVWNQSIYSVHKAKTAVRKKVHSPEGADIVAFLQEKLPLQ